MAKILFKRGNKVNLPSEALRGEPLVSMDTKELFIGQGAGQALLKISDIALSSSAPSDVTKVWIDTTNNVIKRHNGTAWVALSAEAATAASFLSLTGVPGDNTALSTALSAKANASAVYTKTEADQKIADLIGGAPAALDTLNELAAALGDDSNYAGTITLALASKAASADVYLKTETYNQDEVNDLIGAVPAGPQGTQGPQGTTGADSTVQGPQGTQGLTGAQGTQGLTGAQGTQGLTGAQGTQGTQGYQGAASTVQGPQGETGLTGSQGETGSTGLQGPQGVVGDQGATGSQGPQGSVGTQGPQGVVGTQGSTGSQGPQGTQGYQGAASTVEGPQGVQGYQGTQGIAGTPEATLTASTGLTRNVNDFQLDEGVAGDGLVFTTGVLSIGVVDGGEFV